MQQHSVIQSFSNSSSNPSNHDIKLKKKKFSNLYYNQKKKCWIQFFFHAYTQTCSVIFTFDYIIVIHLAIIFLIKLYVLWVYTLGT